MTATPIWRVWAQEELRRQIKLKQEKLKGEAHGHSPWQTGFFLCRLVVTLCGMEIKTDCDAKIQYFIHNKT